MKVTNKFPTLDRIDASLKERALKRQGWGSRFYIIQGSKEFYAVSFNCFERLANTLLKIFGCNYFARALGEKTIKVLNRSELTATPQKVAQLLPQAVAPAVDVPSPVAAPLPSPAAPAGGSPALSPDPAAPVLKKGRPLTAELARLNEECKALQRKVEANSQAMQANKDRTEALLQQVKSETADLLIVLQDIKKIEEWKAQCELARKARQPAAAAASPAKS